MMFERVVAILAGDLTRPLQRLLPGIECHFGSEMGMVRIAPFVCLLKKNCLWPLVGLIPG